MKNDQEDFCPLSINLPGIGTFKAYRKETNYHFSRNEYEIDHVVDEKTACLLLCVSSRTIRSWFSGRHEPPPASVRLMCMHAVGIILPNEWFKGGYRFTENRNYSKPKNKRNSAYQCTEVLLNPIGRPLSPYELEDVANAFHLAEYWRRAYENEKENLDQLNRDKKHRSRHLHSRIEELEFMIMAQQKKLNELEEEKKQETLEFENNWLRY